MTIQPQFILIAGIGVHYTQITFCCIGGTMQCVVLERLLCLKTINRFPFCSLCITLKPQWRKSNRIGYGKFATIIITLLSNITFSTFPHIEVNTVACYFYSAYYCSKLHSPACRAIVILYLTLWVRVTHVCDRNLTIIDSDNGLSPGRRQNIIWTIAVILLLGPLATNFSEILI